MGSINRPKKGSILRKEPIRDENDIILRRTSKTINET
jgi:hypothetical protein